MPLPYNYPYQYLQPQPFNGYTVPMTPTPLTPMPQPTPQPSQNSDPIIWVQGIEAAKSYLVAPGNTVRLWDSERQTIYIKSSDANGIPSMQILDYTIRDNVQNTPKVFGTEYATKNDLEALREEINSLREKVNPFHGESSI